MNFNFIIPPIIKRTGLFCATSLLALILLTGITLAQTPVPEKSAMNSSQPTGEKFALVKENK